MKPTEAELRDAMKVAIEAIKTDCACSECVPHRTACAVLQRYLDAEEPKGGDCPATRSEESRSAYQSEAATRDSIRQGPVAREVSTTPALLPCPFCGAPAQSLLDPSDVSKTGGWWIVGCFRDVGDEDCPGFKYASRTREAAESLWNRRAPDPAVQRVAEEMEKCREWYGELVPFDPQARGFDSTLLAKDGRRRAVVYMMNMVLNGEWLALLRGFVPCTITYDDGRKPKKRPKRKVANADHRNQ